MLRNIKDLVEITGATLLSTKEAKNLLTKKERAYRRWWWLRTPGYIGNYACYVSNFGDINIIGDNILYDSVSMRPALRIKINNSDVKVGDTFKWGGYEFKIISNELAWMYNDDIGHQEFRANYKADNANKYEASDVKKFIDNWFEDLKKNYDN